MKYAIQSSTQVETLEATVFDAKGGRAILTFQEGIGRNINMHIPLSVAQATADAFNAAMAAHEAEEAMTLADFAKEAAA